MNFGLQISTQELRDERRPSKHDRLNSTRPGSASSGVLSRSHCSKPGISPCTISADSAFKHGCASSIRCGSDSTRPVGFASSHGSTRDSIRIYAARRCWSFPKRSWHSSTRFGSWIGRSVRGLCLQYSEPLSPAQKTSSITCPRHAIQCSTARLQISSRADRTDWKARIRRFRKACSSLGEHKGYSRSPSGSFFRGTASRRGGLSRRSPWQSRGQVRSTGTTHRPTISP